MGGKSTTTVQTNVPPPSETELQLQKNQLKVAEAQLAAINQQTAFQQKQFDAAGPLLEGQSKLLQQLIAQQGDLDPELAKKRSALELADLEFALKNAPAQQELLDMQLESLRRGGRASPEEMSTINAATEYALGEGTSDIDAFSADALQQLREELAPALGLRSTDSPILDRGGDIAREGVRQKGQLTRSLRGAQQTATLNFPLAREQFASGVGAQQQSFLEGVKNFQQMLRDSALNARLSLASGLGAPGELAGRLGLGLATGLPGAGQAAGQLAAQRFAGASQTTSQKQGIGLSTLFQGAGAAGGLLQGLGAVGAFASESTLKERIEQVSEDDILAAIRLMPVDEWNYIGDDERHIGPMAEDWRALTGYGDGKTISVIDALGVLFKAVQTLDRKVQDGGPRALAA